MKLNRISMMALCLPLAVLAGCGTPPKRIEAGGANAVTTLGADVRDFKTVAGDLTQSLLVSGVLDRDLGHKPLIFVSHVINNTNERFDTDQVTFKITTDILNSGKAQIAATDPIAKGFADETAFRADQKTKQLPDYVLHAKILWQQARQGNIRENTYTFQFVLSDVKSDSTAWQSEKDFAKQGSRAGVGF